MAFKSKIISNKLLGIWKELYTTKYTRKKIWQNSLLYMFLTMFFSIGIIALAWGWRMAWNFDYKFWILFWLAFIASTFFWSWQIYNKLTILSIFTKGGNEKKLVRSIFWAAGRGGPDSAVGELERYKQKQTQKVNK